MSMRTGGRRGASMGMDEEEIGIKGRTWEGLRVEQGPQTSPKQDMSPRHKLPIIRT